MFSHLIEGRRAWIKLIVQYPESMAKMSQVSDTGEWRGAWWTGGQIPSEGASASGDNEPVFPTSILPFPELGNSWHRGWDAHPRPSHTLCPWLVETNRRNPIHLTVAVSVFQLFQVVQVYAVQVYASPQMVLPKPQEVVQSGPVSRKLRGLCWKIWDTRRLVPSQFYRMQ